MVDRREAALAAMMFAAAAAAAANVLIAIVTVAGHAVGIAGEVGTGTCHLAVGNLRRDAPL